MATLKNCLPKKIMWQKLGANLSCFPLCLTYLPSISSSVQRSVGSVFRQCLQWRLRHLKEEMKLNEDRNPSCEWLSWRFLSWFEHRKKSILGEIFHSGEFSNKDERVCLQMEPTFRFFWVCSTTRTRSFACFSSKGYDKYLWRYRGIFFCHKMLIQFL